MTDNFPVIVINELMALPGAAAPRGERRKSFKLGEGQNARKLWQLRGNMLRIKQTS